MGCGSMWRFVYTNRWSALIYLLGFCFVSYSRCFDLENIGPVAFGSGRGNKKPSQLEEEDSNIPSMLLRPADYSTQDLLGGCFQF